VLNASRRFRYTLDLKKEEEKKQTLRKIRAHAQAIRVQFLHWIFFVMIYCICEVHYLFILLQQAAYLFKAAGGQAQGHGQGQGNGE
jgi:hypothetical protein